MSLSMNAIYPGLGSPNNPTMEEKAAMENKPKQTAKEGSIKISWFGVLIALVLLRVMYEVAE